jgi:hypothetical protein
MGLNKLGATDLPNQLIVVFRVTNLAIEPLSFSPPILLLQLVG